MNRLLITLITLACFLVSGCFENAISGRCVRVSDGDTVTILLPDGTKERIRLRGIDAPESGQDFGKVSKRELIKLVNNREIRVETDGRDRYNRIIGDIYVGQLLVNRELVRLGVAWYYPKYTPDEPELQAAQDEAKAHRRGLWGQRSPLPPWEWRKMNRTGKTQRHITTAEQNAAEGLYWVSKSGKIHKPGCKYYASSKSGKFSDRPVGVNCKVCGGAGNSLSAISSHALNY